MTITIILPRDSLPPPVTIYSDPSCPSGSSFPSSSRATFPDHSSPPYSLCSGIQPPNNFLPLECASADCQLTISDYSHFPTQLPHSGRAGATGSCFWVLTTGGTQAKQMKWTRALTLLGSEGFLCHPLLAFYHPLSLH